MDLKIRFPYCDPITLSTIDPIGNQMTSILNKPMLKTAILPILFLSSVQLLYSCNTSRNVYYAYSTATYAIDTTKNLLRYDKLISFGDYLFEFKTEVQFNRHLYGDDRDSMFVAYDTIGVFLLSSTEKKFYEFDTFALNNKLLTSGELREKPFGLRLSSSAEKRDTTSSYGPLSKRTINNIPFFVTEVFSTNRSQDKTVKQKVILIQGSEFNSLFKINGIRYPDSNYCIVGFQIYDREKEAGVIQEIESLRPLNKKEKALCEKMIEKSKSYIPNPK